ncbi:hypothetical protein [Candidatus Hepatobacter penaei]|uniref:hypothetical protein n=1 Tax=Candidatus Hepatobacter penaei TaxID=1274402 RepID=UPI0004F3C2B8|nr:hypothetical protein [Candidatus Hepatobacter penaei]
MMVSALGGKLCTHVCLWIGFSVYMWVYVDNVYAPDHKDEAPVDEVPLGADGAGVTAPAAVPGPAAKPCQAVWPKVRSQPFPHVLPQALSTHAAPASGLSRFGGRPRQRGALTEGKDLDSLDAFIDEKARMLGVKDPISLKTIKKSMVRAEKNHALARHSLTRLEKEVLPQYTPCWREGAAAGTPAFVDGSQTPPYLQGSSPAEVFPHTLPEPWSSYEIHKGLTRMIAFWHHHYQDLDDVYDDKEAVYLWRYHHTFHRQQGEDTPG